jgi:hypothetical protein
MQVCVFIEQHINRDEPGSFFSADGGGVSAVKAEGRNQWRQANTSFVKDAVYLSVLCGSET